jgi:hypothetical protein
LVGLKILSSPGRYKSQYHLNQNNQEQMKGHNYPNEGTNFWFLFERENGLVQFERVDSLGSEELEEAGAEDLATCCF